MLRLSTFVISHFSEKARWALDLAGARYTERRLIPGPHMIAIRGIAPRTTVPVLEHDGRVVQGSGRILDYVEERLGGSGLGTRDPKQRTQLSELEALADHALGLGVQTIAYAELLAHRALVTDLWCQDGPSWARRFYSVAYPGVAAAVRRMYDTRPRNVERAKVRFRDAIRQFDDLLEAQPFIGGDAPNRGDITLAALLAPMCRPPEHLVRWPSLPGELDKFVGEFEGSPTFRHVRRMYTEHRKPTL
jgi:glutathione S-transferase